MRDFIEVERGSRPLILSMPRAGRELPVFSLGGNRGKRCADPMQGLPTGTYHESLGAWVRKVLRPALKRIIDWARKALGEQP